MEGKSKGRTLIIIPAYNEADNIGEVLKTLKEQIEGDGSAIRPYINVGDIVVVDDGSSDHTGDIVQSFGIKLISHKNNRGYGVALQSGYRYALEQGYDYIIQMDGDGQHDCGNIPRLCMAGISSGAPDIILGSRFLEDSENYPMSRVRLGAYRYFSRLIFLFSGRNITDCATGLQLLNRRTFEYYAGEGNYDDRCPDANILLKMLLMGYDIYEIPAIMHERKSGRSMYAGIKSAIYMIRMTLDVLGTGIKYKLTKKI